MFFRKRKSELESSVNSIKKQSSGRGSGTPIKDSNGNLNSSISSNSELLSKRQRKAEKLAKKEEKKSANRQDSKESRESKDEEKFHRTEVMYPCLSDLRVPQTEILDEESVMG